MSNATNQYLKDLLWEEFDALYSHDEAIRMLIWEKCFSFMTQFKIKHFDYEFDALESLFEQMWDWDADLMNWNLKKAIILYANRM